MDVKATLETRKRKDGSGEYKVIVIKLSDKSEKLVFLTPSEQELLELSYNKALKDSDSFDWLKVE